MTFQDAYKAYVLTEAKVWTMEEVGKLFMAEYLHDKQGTEIERLARAHKRLDDASRACGPLTGTLTSIFNLECFVLCYDLLRQETGRK